MMMTLNQKNQILKDIIKICKKAGDQIMIHYRKDLDIKYKSDQSPLTKADQESHQLITTELKKLTPKILIISEEGDHEININQDRSFWLVDPLDGTKEFIKNTKEFTVNISYIENKQPILGVICAPALNMIYAGIVGNRAFKIINYKQIIPIRAIGADYKDPLIILGSRSHGDPELLKKFLSSYPKVKCIPVGSSLKFCIIAEGLAHIYPRFGSTMEWDTAAGQAILIASGGAVKTIDHKDLIYGKKKFKNPHYIAYGKYPIFNYL